MASSLAINFLQKTLIPLGAISMLSTMKAGNGSYVRKESREEEKTKYIDELFQLFESTHTEYTIFQGTGCIRKMYLVNLKGHEQLSVRR